MASIPVGFGRLFHAPGCTLASSEEWSASFAVSDTIRADVYIGPAPPGGIFDLRVARHYILQPKPNRLTLNIYQDAADAGIDSGCLVLIRAWTDLEFPDDLVKRCLAKQPGTDNESIKLAETRERELAVVVDLVAGTLGLLAHPQFVHAQLSEQLIVKLPGLTFRGYPTQSFTLLEGLALNTRGERLLGELWSKLDTADATDRLFAARLYQWLLRAWSEPDLVTRFLSLFIPLEVILDEFGNEQQRIRLKLHDQITALVAQHGGECVDAMLEFLKGIRGSTRLPLRDRFELMARESALPGFEGDIAAFRRFNNVRNEMVHKGKRPATAIANIGEDDVRQLHDLVERYVSCATLGEVRPYRWAERPLRPQGPEEYRLYIIQRNAEPLDEDTC